MNRDREDQFLPRQRRDVTYVSRLQSVQAAIDHQLQEMEKEFPNRRVALVTFNNEVSGNLIGFLHANLSDVKFSVNFAFVGAGTHKVLVHLECLF